MILHILSVGHEQKLGVWWRFAEHGLGPLHGQARKFSTPMGPNFCSHGLYKDVRGIGRLDTWA